VSPPAVAVAVVSWNTAELLDRCLAALRADHEAGLAEVWVVDNASTDGSAALVAERHPWVGLEAGTENLGFGAAVNLVAARTRTPFLAAANADVAPEPAALAALLDAAARAPRAGALAPRLLRPDGTTQHAVHPFPTVRTGLLLSSGLARRPAIARRLPLEGFWDPQRERTVDWAHGAFLLLRREAWDAVGGFDPEQWLYAEDLDLCWRLRRAGWTTRYVPAARVAHAVSAATAGRWSDPERAVRTQRSAYAWLLARRGIRATRAVALAHLVGPAVRAALLGAGTRVAPGRWAQRAATQRGYRDMHRTGLEPAAALAAHRRRRG
jgi:N-acetylglucosaminyl-diphospho-decaprenol L-rhamnosyltransferase